MTGHMPPNPFADPEGFQAYQREQFEKHMMKVEDYRRSLNTFLAEAPADQLLLISNMLVSIGANEGAVRYYEGQFDTALQMRFNICAVHGVDHDDEAQKELLGDESDGELGDDEQIGSEIGDAVRETLEADIEVVSGDRIPEQRTSSDVPDAFKILKVSAQEEAEVNDQAMLLRVLDKSVDHHELFDYLETSLTKTEIGSKSKMLNELEQTICEVWNLDDLRDNEENNTLLGFVCKNCGQRYPSLQDRILKAPDDCSGCHSKSRWG